MLRMPTLSCVECSCTADTPPGTAACRLLCFVSKLHFLEFLEVVVDISGLVYACIWLIQDDGALTPIWLRSHSMLWRSPGRRTVLLQHKDMLASNVRMEHSVTRDVLNICLCISTSSWCKLPCTALVLIGPMGTLVLLQDGSSTSVVVGQHKLHPCSSIEKAIICNKKHH